MILGIDPGKGGAIAFLDEATRETSIIAMPLILAPKGRQEYDLDALRRLFARWAPQPPEPGLTMVFIERQQALPATLGGTLANFGRGLGLGVLQGMLTMALIPYELVTPRRWQGAMLEGIPGKDTKQQAVLAAQRLFPGVSLLRTPKSRRPDPGFAEALLIAEWGRRKLSR